MKPQRGRCYLLAVLFIAALPAAAQGPLVGPESAFLLTAGKWIASTLAAYPLGKALDAVVDKVTGKNLEKQLRALEARLQGRLDQRTADGKRIEGELGLVRSELKVLQHLMEGIPSPALLAHDKSEIRADIVSIQKTLAEHDKRLTDHDQLLAQQQRLIEEQGRHLSDLDQRVGALSMSPKGAEESHLAPAGVAAPPAEVRVVKPSFDCAKARTPSELMICDDGDLASSERAMSSAYFTVLSRLSGGERTSFRQEHLRWFKEYIRTCNVLSGDALRNCVRVYLDNRARDLQALENR